MCNNNVQEQDISIFNFVNRDKELEVFKSALQKRSQIYLSFIGMAGQGKTRLLHWICYQNSGPRYHAVYIDLMSHDLRRAGIAPFLQVIVDSLSEDPAVSAIFEPFVEQLQQYEEERKEIDLAFQKKSHDGTDSPTVEPELIRVFNKNFATYLRKKSPQKIILCFDDTDRITESRVQKDSGDFLAANWEKLEDKVLAHCLNYNNFMLITAGQTKPPWKSIDLRRRFKRIDLSLFDKDTIVEQIKNLVQTRQFNTADIDIVSQHLHRMTQGHPLSVQYAVDYWTQDQDGPQSLCQKNVEEQKYYKKCVTKLREEVVEEKFLRNFELSEKYPGTLKVLQYLSSLRRFNFSSFYSMLDCFFPLYFEDKPDQFFHDLLESLLAHKHIVEWMPGIGYVWNPVMRAILLEDLRIRDREQFLSIQEHLIQLFKKRRKAFYEEGRVQILLDLLYHEALAYLGKNVANRVWISQEEQTKLADYLSTKLKDYIKQDLDHSDETEEPVTRRTYLDSLQQEIEYNQDLIFFVETSDLQAVIQSYKVQEPSQIAQLVAPLEIAPLEVETEPSVAITQTI